MKTNIAFAGGGTGGHIFPIKSLIENIDTTKYTIFWFGEKNSLEEKISKELINSGKDIIFIPFFSGKIRRSFNINDMLLNIIDFLKNIIGFFQSIYYILKYNPKFIFSKGGFIAFSPSLAGKILFKKIYVHESDTIPGLVNKLISTFADKTYLGFEITKKYIKTKKVEFSGQILGNKFYENIEYEKHKRTKLLIIGGSQGAKTIIDAVKTLLDNGELKNFDIYIVGGIKNDKNIFKDYENVYFFGFLSQNELIEIYKKVDLSITRGSATSLAEQDQFDIKKIIVPLPYTGGNHQYYNALEYEKKGDILINQLDKDLIKKLGLKLKELENYHKIKGTYRQNNDGKIKILKNVLD